MPRRIDRRLHTFDANPSGVGVGNLVRLDADCIVDDSPWLARATQDDREHRGPHIDLDEVLLVVGVADPDGRLDLCVCAARGVGWVTAALVRQL